MKNEKILIIDDSEDDRLIVKKFLLEAGYEKILLAETAEEGAKKVKAEKPDLVLLDINLPLVDGIRTCSILKSWYKTLPVIIMTGLSDPTLKDLAKSHNADEYITKPIDKEELKVKIETVLKKGGTENGKGIKAD